MHYVNHPLKEEKKHTSMPACADLETRAWIKCQRCVRLFFESRIETGVTALQAMISFLEETTPL